MPDPVRIKKRGQVFAEVKMVEGGKERQIKLDAFVNAETWETATEEQRKAFLHHEIENVSPSPVSGIYSNMASFKYVDPSALKDFDYGNVLVELHIPYCIDVPNGYEMEVLLASGDKVLMIPSKIWTQKAQSNVGAVLKKSSTADFFAEDTVLHFKKAEIVGAKQPRDPSEGWEENFTGINIQRIKDATGRFRFSHLYIQFDLPATKQELDDEENRKKKLQLVESMVLEAVNKLIDAYRFTTKQEHIARLGAVAINMVYFIDLDEGFYMSHVNIEHAIMNRSKKEMEEIKRMLKAGESPNLYELLLLDAKQSYAIKNYSLAIVQSFQALEIFIENFLIAGLQRVKGISELDAISYLSQGDNWKTKTRLKELLKEVKGVTVPSVDNPLWIRWSHNYDNIRNEVIHKGKEATDAEVKETLEANERVISLIQKLP